MDFNTIALYKGFYENELTNRFLSFWLPRCEDTVHGGFYNCFDNEGKILMSKDKYTWSQGRFVWCFSALSATKAPIFAKAQRTRFLELAIQGADFLMKHCLMGPDDWRCVFLMDEEGNPKYVEGFHRYDMSISADHFVIGGLARCSRSSGERKYYEFAKKLYQSAVDRLQRNDFESLPYPLRKDLRSHGMPMIMENVSKDMYLAALQFDPRYAEEVQEKMGDYTKDVLTNFVDQNHLLHEVIQQDNQFFSEMLGQHINPGHTLEDSWFMLDNIELTHHEEWSALVLQMIKKTLETGWDAEAGGILHYASLVGGKPRGNNERFADEPMSKQLLGWGDKLWWVHSEALYATLRAYIKTGDDAFLEWHEKVRDYTYRTFPQKDPEIREWIQIRNREGKPQDVVVALPVKDPFHVIRNLLLMIEALYEIG